MLRSQLGSRRNGVVKQDVRFSFLCRLFLGTSSASGAAASFTVDLDFFTVLGAVDEEASALIVDNLCEA
jgi:hypothetical protein